ncbi:MAG: hypothetical protein H7256_09915 [Bdellovibrio sp.]|nr:hypothetical protein [Bdellovibrio sp.]
MKSFGISLCALVVVLASQSSFAKSGGVRAEAWKCYGTTQDGYVKSLQVNVDVIGMKSSGLLYDGTMSQEGIEVGADKSDLSKLDGAVVGHDQRFYTIDLIRTNEQSIGSAVVSYNGFIDCVGDVSGVETLACEIEVEK